MPIILEYPLLLVFPAAMAFAAAMDLFTMTIPNRVSLALLATFVLAAPLSGMAWTTFLSHFGAGALMLVVGIVMFSRGWLGGGDAKLMAAATLWLGFENLLPFMFWAVLLGGVLAVVILVYRSLVPPLWVANQSWALRLHDNREGIPYGVALAGAGLLIYPSMQWVAGLTG
jgi:prepilin peptidase CpaA